MPFWKEKWDTLGEKTQKRLQIIAGVLLGCGCWGSLLLSPSEDENSGSLFFIIAAVIVLVVPRMLETQTGSKLLLMKKVMLITLGVVFAGWTAVYFLFLRQAA